MEVIESKRKGSFLAEFMLLKSCIGCTLLKTKAGMKRIRHFCTTFRFFKLQMLEIKETC